MRRSRGRNLLYCPRQHAAKSANLHSYSESDRLNRKISQAAFHDVVLNYRMMKVVGNNSNDNKGDGKEREEKILQAPHQSFTAVLQVKLIHDVCKSIRRRLR